MIALGFGIGWMLGGPGFDTRRALALGTGQRNIAAVDPPAKADSGDDRGEIVIEQDQGGGFARNVRACVLPDGAFRLVQGEPKGVQRTTGSGRVSTRWVCPECGVWVCTAPRPGTTVRNVRGGTLDDTSWLRPTAHIWTRSKQPWVPLSEADRKFETQPPGDPWWASVTPAG